MLNNNEVVELKEKLELFIPIVDKVHGSLHPEMHEVRAVYNQLAHKLTNNDNNLASEFIKLKEITANYLVPSDVCESYEAVYKMLERLNIIYDEIKQ